MAGPVDAKIVTWNVGQRGLRRTVSEVFGGSMTALLQAVGAPSILCLQETKVSRVDLARGGDALVRIPGV
jgi:exonuclease III